MHRFLIEFTYIAISYKISVEICFIFVSSNSFLTDIGQSQPAFSWTHWLNNHLRFLTWRQRDNPSIRLSSLLQIPNFQAISIWWRWLCDIQRNAWKQRIVAEYRDIATKRAKSRFRSIFLQAHSRRPKPRSKDDSH